MTTIWRINLKPDSQKGLDPRKFCIKNGIIGIGWAVDIEATIDWSTYTKNAEKKFSHRKKEWRSATNAIKNKIMIDDLCWTRDWQGMYYLGRIKSDWYYKGDDEYRKHNIVNIRDCEWYKAGTMDNVPGKIINSFIPNRTLQKVNGVLEFSRYLYNNLSSSSYYSLQTKGDIDLFSLLSSEDCEDLVALYLQNKGYMIIPTTYQRSTMNLEFIAINKATGEVAGTQVKNGHVDLHIENYAYFPGKVFLFTTRGNYYGKQSSTVVCIKPSEILDFIYSNSIFMPKRIKMWQNIYKTISI